MTQDATIDQIRQTVLQCLGDCLSSSERQVADLEKVIARHGQQTCKVILQQLAHVDLNDSEAEHFWTEVVSHQEGMSRTLGRGVSLHTAVCDYFCSVRKSMKHPTVVEMQTLEQTIRDSTHDFLTGLLNRKVFDFTLAQEIARANRYNREVTLLFFDLDDFKTINDSFGHPTGDKVLQEFARIIESEKRIEDSAARYGGEEFVVILPDTGKRAGLILAERIRERVEKTTLLHEGQPVHFTVSGGLATCPDAATDRDALLRFADHALYMAKDAGKNTIVSYRNEKRRYLRIDFVRDIKARLQTDKKQEELRLVSKDIGLGGILFENSIPIDVGSHIELLLDIAPEENLTLAGKVVRLEVLANGKYELGVAFLTLHGDTDHALSRHICQHLCPQNTHCRQTRKILTANFSTIESCPC